MRLTARNIHIWNVSAERAEDIYQLIQAYNDTRLSRDELQERLLRLGMPKNLTEGDELQIKITKRVQSNGAKMALSS